MKRYNFSYDNTWPAAFLLDPVNFEKNPGGWCLPFSVLGRGSEFGEGSGGSVLLNDAKEAIVRLAGGESVQEAVLREFGGLRMDQIPADLDDICLALSTRTELRGGKVELSTADRRRNFWLKSIYHLYPHTAIAAGELLSAHVTSCATERNWSLFGNIFTKTRNRLALERAQKIAFTRNNLNSLKGAKGTDEEIQLSVIDLIGMEEAEEEEEEEEEGVEEMEVE